MYLKFNHIHFKTDNSQKALLPPSNEVCEGYVFTRICHSVHGGGVSQHALQGGIPACLAGLRGGLQAHTRWGGIFRPTPGRVYHSMHWSRPPPSDGYCRGQYASYWKAFLSSYYSSTQIVAAMGPMFQLMNEAVEGIRNQVQKAFNSQQTFTREDKGHDQYQICCRFQDHPMFPNVSKT